MTEFTMHGEMSRRRFIKNVTAFSMVSSGLAATSSARPLSGGRILAYVGTYTGAVGNGGNGEGIYRFEFNPTTGELTQRDVAAISPSPSWVVIHPSKKFLYAVNEVSDFEGGNGSVSAFAIDGEGKLGALGVESSGGAGPCFVSVDKDGRYAFVANYAGGTVAVLPIHGDGTVGKASDVHRDNGDRGSGKAQDAPDGSFAFSGHDGPHAHMIGPSPDGNFVLATDLGQDRIYVYRFDAVSGKLSLPATAGFTALASGDGPRHFVFHPNRPWLYSIQEEASNIAFFQFDAAKGELIHSQTISCLPAGFAGTSFASAIVISPDGRFLYAANRLHDTIAILSIGSDGRLNWLGEVSTMGDYPVHCRIDPSGRFMFVCNRRSDCITSFRINRERGLLEFTGRYTAVGSPASIVFLG